MSRNVKILLVIVGSLFAICCMLSIVAVAALPKLAENAFTQDTQKAKQVAAQIADFSVPPGYAEQFSMDIVTTKMVLIGRPDNRGLNFMLMQIAQGSLSREQMEAQMRQSFQQQ